MLRRTFVKGVAAASIMGLTATDLEAKYRRKKVDNSKILTGNK